MRRPDGRRYDRQMGTSPPTAGTAAPAPWHSQAADLGPRKWRVVDAFLAAGMSLLVVATITARYGVFPASFGHHPELPQWRLVLLYLFGALATLPVAVRKRWPLPVLAVVLVSWMAFSALGPVTGVFTPAIFALYTVSALESRRRSLLALAAVEAGVILVVVLRATDVSNQANDALTSLVLEFTVWLIGDAVRRHRAEVIRQRQQALAEQRLEIARELHDIVAHALSVVAVQAGVGSHLIASHPDKAARSLHAIEATARTALAETRQVLGAIRGDGHDPADLAPMPGIGSIGSLVSQVCDAGQPVSLLVEGEPRALSSSLELSAYRVVQEALTNVVRHAVQPATAQVVISYGDDGVLVTVTDDGGAQRLAPRSHGPGHGLIGMRERVSLLGGELQAGPRAEGGYEVVARLPAGAHSR
jgi:signal transduction histidine kinase